MDPFSLAMLGSAAVGAIGSIGSAAIGGAVAHQGQVATNAEARLASAKQMAFQERMARNSYRYAMEDMGNAGLNPILAYKQGGAATPGGSSYTPGNPGAAAVAGASSAMAAKRQMDMLVHEIDRLGSETDRNNEQARLFRDQRAQVKAGTAIMGQEFYSAKAAADRAKIDTEIYNSKWGEFLRNVDIAGRSVNPFADAASSAAQASRGK